MVRTSLPFSRWWLVVVASLLMGAAGTYQFLWSSIRGPLGMNVGASEPALGTVFTLFVVALTLAQFPAGWVRDRRGPRLPLLVGGVALAGGFVGTAYATSPVGLALAYTLGGIGAGIAYTVAVNTPVKWLDKRQGLATGVVVMSFGGLSFLLIPWVRREVTVDLEGALVVLGAIAGGVALIAIVFLRDPIRESASGEPEAGTTSSLAMSSSRPAYTWRETTRTWQFWLLYLVFVVVNGIGVMIIGKSIAYAEALGLTAAIATGGAALIAIGDAAGVLLGSAVSDRLGRERTAGAALSLTGVAVAGTAVAAVAGSGIAFVVLLGAAAFFRSPVFAIFPVMVGEYYGERYSSTNYAALYSSKLWGAVLGGAVASALVVWLGWTQTFVLGAAITVVAGLAAFFLKPP